MIPSKPFSYGVKIFYTILWLYLPRILQDSFQIRAATMEATAKLAK